MAHEESRRLTQASLEQPERTVDEKLNQKPVHAIHLAALLLQTLDASLRMVLGEERHKALESKFQEVDRHPSNRLVGDLSTQKAVLQVHLKGLASLQAASDPSEMSPHQELHSAYRYVSFYFCFCSRLFSCDDVHHRCLDVFSVNDLRQLP